MKVEEVKWLHEVIANASVELSQAKEELHKLHGLLNHVCYIKEVTDVAGAMEAGELRRAMKRINAKCVEILTALSPEVRK